jgi:ADP-ribose pyrophosphatase YjhB (NUDIX family)
MSNTKEDIVDIALAVVKNSDGEVLIIKRKNPETGSDGSSLAWAFPGGLVEKYSTHKEAVEESVLGETGHYISVGELINKRKHPQFPAKVHYYSCKLTTDATTQFIEEDEVEQISWVSPTTLGDYFETDFDKKVQKFLGL